MMIHSIPAGIAPYIHSHYDDFVHLLCQIISIPSPTGQEQAKAEWILNYLHRMGETQAYIDKAGNVICPCQTEGHETFPLYNAHIDTVFTQLKEITPSITGNILAAPSCGDNSSSVAGLLFILTMIRDLQLALPKGALFAFNVGEEGLGNLKGMRQLMADWKQSVSEVVAVDCTYDQVVSLPVGSRRYTVSIDAEGGHSWMHFGHTNAIAAAAAIITRLYAMSVPTSPKTTYNIGTIQGGTTVNSIAAHAEFTVDLRSESHDELQKLDDTFAALIKDEQNDKITITKTLIGERPCSNGTTADEQCRRIAAIRKEKGLLTTFISGSTDANIPLSLGIPAISFGICRSQGEHTVHETLELDTIEPGLLQFVTYMLS